MPDEAKSGTAWLWLSLLGLGGVVVYRRAELRVAEQRAEQTLGELEAEGAQRGLTDSKPSEEEPLDE